MNPQPFNVKQKRQPQLPGSVARQYRPMTDPSLPQAVQDAFRQMPDQIYNLRQKLGPANISVAGVGNPITVTVLSLGAGLTLKLTRPGTWIIAAAVALSIVGDNGQIFTLSLSVAGGRQGLVGTWQSPGDAQVMMHQQWSFVSQNGDDTCVLLIQKDAGTGTSAVIPINSTLVATYAGTQ